MTRCFLAGVGLLVILLQGCASRPTVIEPPVDLAQLSDWQARGRIAISRGKEGFNGGFSWHQAGPQVTLNIRGPLGFGRMTIEGSQDELLLTHRGKTTALDEPERDIAAITGWWLPIASMSHWLRAQPDPTFSAEVSSNDDGSLARLEQRGWAAAFSSYRQQNGVTVPRKMELSDGDMRVRVVVDRWDLRPDAN